MRKKIVLLLSFLSLSSIMYASEIKLSPQEIDIIGQKVFKNECASKNEKLIHYEAASFVSLGIGHFIWYPKDYKGPFEETFPDFLIYAKKSGAKIPDWLNEGFPPPCPWNSEEAFLRDQKDNKMLELREFLVATKTLQAEFIVKRLDNSLNRILRNAPREQRNKIRQNFNRLSANFQGVYILIDYINFKGLGILPTERYNGQGWGLLQVLSEMRSDKEAPDAIKEFAETAKKIISERVKNSPQERNEQKWLPGWIKRIESYTK